ncbi:hypothetical protein BDY19DRAFT_992203 [Irpex rosettiformis]|uniref:Uncharacterized protein n=1 Tax=Irpex rosettiformis TaxID=378272 RepID=A0ACB8U914_9APHY|nr:hypothetical protein BDY19DRAFT_992203 [Irpex rosettiformis]
MDPRRREIFMNIPAVRSQPEQSFEELRVNDYIKAYSSTGRLPQPCPPVPLHPADRARAGLPPIFQPYVEVGGVPSKEDPVAVGLQVNSSSTQGPPPQDLNALPDVQLFVPQTDASESGQAVHLQSIVAQHTFSVFSFEELRYQAYRSGKKVVLEAISNTPAVPTLLVTPPAPGVTSDQYQSITCTPPFQKHSFEELRLAQRRTGRDLTSEQIIQMRVI